MDGRCATPRGAGQDKLAEIQNILHETITGNRIVKAFSMELWETTRFKAAAKRLFSANMRYVVAMAVSSPLMDLLGAVAIALLLKLGRDSINHGTMTIGGFMVVHRRDHQSLPAGAQVCDVLQQLSAGAGSFGIGLQVHGRQGRGAREGARRASCRAFTIRSALKTCASPTAMAKTHARC